MRESQQSIERMPIYSELRSPEVIRNKLAMRSSSQMSMRLSDAYSSPQDAFRSSNSSVWNQQHPEIAPIQLTSSIQLLHGLRDLASPPIGNAPGGNGVNMGAQVHLLASTMAKLRQLMDAQIEHLTSSSNESDNPVTESSTQQTTDGHDSNSSSFEPSGNSSNDLMQSKKEIEERSWNFLTQ
ncbi:MAG: hypothetical protein EZS28_001184 [Streblomastix strix]|uniref:Uncharacterized protein n=1 Tax=Streblomastix strix TaxID=222440 RepID=A0A5J4X8U0_9EUKA|nr:MAG: hypothetical protein EZS28_001184 [Streblomastix strix]